MFDRLSDKLANVFKKLKGHGKLTEPNINDALREVRLALLEADVNYKVAKSFVDGIRQRALGQRGHVLFDPRSAGGQNCP